MGEMSGACAGGGPTQNSDDDEMLDSDEESDDSSMQYSPASPGAPMSVQQLNTNDDAGNHATAQNSRRTTVQNSRRTTDTNDAGNHATAQNSCRITDTSTVPDERRPRLTKEWRPANVEVEDDFEPMFNFLGQEELMSHELQQCAAETVRLVAALGRQRTGYRRERRQAVRRMVAEVYSVARVTKAFKLLPSLDFLPGFALELSGEDDEGQTWDFIRTEMQEKARALLLKEKPLVLIGSPPCTSFCN